MEKIRYPLRTNIGYFLTRPIGFSKDFHIEYPEIFIEPDLQIYNLFCDYTFSRTREGLLLQADLSGEIEAQCARCLEITRITVKTNFEELYVFESRSQEIFDEEIVPEDGYIDLGVLFRDYLLLEVPMNVICSPDCKGICTICGKNLNLGECEHTNNRIKFD